MSIIIKQQDEIEIYVNEALGITISSKDLAGHKTIISFGREHVNEICSAIKSSAIEIDDE